jgi:potassium-transporting ATPase KdpC subunit
MKTLRTCLSLLLALTVITGLVYPGLVTLFAALAFPAKATGSILPDGNGSVLIGQPFSGPQWFWGRPSATADHPYNALASGASNLGPSNPALRQAVQERIEVLKAADPTNTAPVPIDLVTASASGLDPDISPEAAFYQVSRVARTRGLDTTAVRALVERCVVEPPLGIIGAPRVRVLTLNEALEALSGPAQAR